MKSLLAGCLFVVAMCSAVFAQEREILLPKPISGAPFHFDDSEDLFGKAYRWFLEGEPEFGADSLKKLVVSAGYNLQAGSYYVVVANFTDNFTQIGMFHDGDSFLSTRMFGLGENNLYYIYISRQQQGASFLSVVATSKASPFEQNFLSFLGLFQSWPIPARAEQLAAAQETWVDVRQFEVPKAYRANSDLSFLVKKDLSDEKFLTANVFDNTSRERWSFGIATAITSINDVDIEIGNDGTIIVKPKPIRDLATFGAINYHFQPVDTKAKTVASSFHLLGGVRFATNFEPLIGVGGGLALGFADIHLFAGYSVEFAQQLKEGFSIGQKITSEVDPFKLKIRGKPRFGLELKFP